MDKDQTETGKVDGYVDSLTCVAGYVMKVVKANDRLSVRLHVRKSNSYYDCFYMASVSDFNELSKLINRSTICYFNIKNENFIVDFML